MIYQQLGDVKVSQLGMGNMRLPTTGEGGAIDQARARAILEHAYENGVNYFDTAYRYHGGQSELFVGRVLNELPRDSWYLASKMPGHMMRYDHGRLSFVGYLAGEKVRTVEEIFQEQLEKCQVDYFDFYLLHNVCETSYDFYTNEDLGVVDYLLEQKRKGRIRHLGFSSHGRPETIERFLNWRDCFEFAQIQLNYLDWSLQQAKEKYDLLTRRNIPVVVMEPCRGGRLANLDDKIAAPLKQARPEASLASWAFRFLQALPNVKVVLSGMTTMEQLTDNLKTFSVPCPMQAQEAKLLKTVVSALVSQVPCTGCRYCCEECPQGLDIPRLIALYNEMSYEPTPGLNAALGALTDKQHPANCVGCGACKRICPQGIDIPALMQSLAQAIAKRS